MKPFYCMDDAAPCVKQCEACNKATDKTFARPSASARPVVDIPMIEAACEVILDRQGVDIGGEAMREALQAALAKASAAPLTGDLKACIEFWTHYSTLNEPGQDDITAEKEEMLEKMRGWLAAGVPSAGGRTLQWVSVEERMPETADPVMVYVPGNKHLKHAIDQWMMQREAPVSFSSATIETGMAWCDHEYEEVTHWAPLTVPGEAAGHSVVAAPSQPECAGPFVDAKDCPLHRKDVFASSASAARPSIIPLIKRISGQRDELYNVLHDIYDRGLLSGFGGTESRVKAALDKVPSYEQRLQNIAEGIGLTVEELRDRLGYDKAAGTGGTNAGEAK